MTALPATSSVSSPTQPSSPSKANHALGLQLSDVGRRYGACWALRRVSLRIVPGEYVLLRGPNGSGKSTLLRVAATLVRPTTGRVEYPGTASENVPRARIGFVAHGTMLYDDLSAVENLQFYGNLYGLPGLPARVNEALRSVGLADRRDSPVRTFSRGMRQRLSLARALLHAPGLLLLDEPVTGLDRQAYEWLVNTLARLHADGCTIVMSTHESHDVPHATRCIWLQAGQVRSDTALPGSNGHGERQGP